MLCSPILENTEVFSERSMEEFWSTTRDALTFCQNALNRSLSAGPLKFPLSYSDLKQEDLRDISSTVASLCGHDSDQNITASMMGFLFKCRKQREPFHFDFSMTIAKTMVKQLSKFQQLRHFRFSSILVHLLLHPNEAFFAQFMCLSTFDEMRSVLSVSCWTSLLLASYDSYQFSDLFLAPILKYFGVIPNEPLSRFSQVQMN